MKIKTAIAKHEKKLKNDFILHQMTFTSQPETESRKV